MFTITKDVYFCYGHRLMNHPGKCRHVHGHSVKAAITVAADTLNDQSMVCDFSDIHEIVQQYVDTNFDHNLLLYRQDPLIPLLREAGERFLELDDHPTAEILAQRIFQFIKTQGLNVVSVTLWETSSASACYREQSVA